MDEGKNELRDVRRRSRGSGVQFISIYLILKCYSHPLLVVLRRLGWFSGYNLFATRKRSKPKSFSIDPCDVIS